jgi:hypothetical protein
MAGGLMHGVLALIWITANFHAHAANDLLRDDGSETPAQLHRALKARGFDFSVHSAHSVFNEKAEEEFREQRAAEARAVPGMTCVLGEELTVAGGPNFQESTKVLGKNAPGNLNHLTVFGMKELIPTGTPVAEACERAHAGGGVCLVNHPGPGPMMWEEGLWESEARRAKPRGKIDGLEVYNGQALSAIAIDFESRYLEATAYSGLGLKIAAVTGADTHGPKSVERARAKVAGLGMAGKLLKLVAPGSSEPRAELEAATRVLAESSSETAVIEALKARRTIATYAMRGVRAELPGLGEVKRTGDVELHLTLSRAVGEIVLYKDGKEAQRWSRVSEARFTEKIAQPAAYVFAARDGAGRLLTSAIWYEPDAR